MTTVVLAHKYVLCLWNPWVKKDKMHASDVLIVVKFSVFFEKPTFGPIETKAVQRDSPSDCQ